VAGKKRSGGSRGPSLPRAAAEAVEQAAELVQRRRFSEALALLQEVDRQFPSNFVVLQLMGEAAYETGDDRLFLDVSDRMAAAAPDDPDVLGQRAYAHLRMGFAFLAQRYFQHLVQRWPDEDVAARARTTLTEIEPAIRDTAEQMERAGFPAADVPELSARHEQVQVWLARGKYADARRVAAQLLSRWPKFVAAHNNVAEAWAREGNLAQAAAATRQALAVMPDNAHALAALVKLLVLDGKADEARQTAARLKALPVQNPDNRVKIAEVLSLLGDDEGVLAVWAAAEQEGFRLMDYHLAYLHHLAAVAAYRRGDERHARELWARCLRAAPNFIHASECIDDLDQPVGRQNGPYACPLEVILAATVQAEIRRRFSEVRGIALATKFRDDARRFLQQSPQVHGAMPMLLERGDPLGRRTALILAATARTPQTLAMLRAFALSQNGPDRLRIQAAQALAGTEQSLGAEARLWLKGEWRAFRLVESVISSDPTGAKLPGRADKLLARGHAAMQGGDAAEAEALFRQALAVVPDSPSLVYNLAHAIIAQGRQGEGEEMLRDVAAKHPDYLFGALARARQLVEQGELDEAEALIGPTQKRPVLHVTEFVALAIARIELALARRQTEVARDWYLLLDAVDPDNPNLEALAGRVGEKL
jgi:tetratricopeptide (TPR) repeat protein